MTSLAKVPHSFVLSESRLLRQLTVLFFYFAQGFPVGVFLYAIPAWMAANGMGTLEIAAVVSAAMLPWSLKFVNGFIIDRYTFLAMGRRRAWILGAQAMLVLSFVVGALISPLPSDVMVISAIGFAANLATTVQDVGIDSLVVDIMEEEERSKASGFMYGGQVIGISVATAAAGAAFAAFGFFGGMMVAALVPALVFFYGILIVERAGERRLPWTKGEAHPEAKALQVEAWWPLLKGATMAMIAPISLLVLPVLLVRALPWGGFEAFHPVLFTQIVGWELDGWTSFYSMVTLAAGVLGLTAGGLIVSKLGPQRSILFAASIGAMLCLFMGLNKPAWADENLSLAFVIAIEMTGVFYFVAAIPLAMRICHPAVAATQFTIYMAIANFGRPLGASVAAIFESSPEFMYFASFAAWILAAAIMLVVKFPTTEQIGEPPLEAVPEGLAPAARIN